MAPGSKSMENQRGSCGIVVGLPRESSSSGQDMMGGALGSSVEPRGLLGVFLIAF